METKDYLTNYYERYNENGRLISKHGMVEYITTMKYVEKYLQPGMRILEIGAATGGYSHSLAQKGYGMDAVELVEHNIEIFKQNTTPGETVTMTQGNCPTHTSFIPLSFLETQMNWGWHMYALYAGKKIIGYMSLSKERDDAYELHNLAVLPEYRHKGFGKLLLDHTKDTVKSLGGSVIKIGIIEESTVLKNWYMSNGFVHMGTKKFGHVPFTSGYLEWKGE